MFKIVVIFTTNLWKTLNIDRFFKIAGQCQRTARFTSPFLYHFNTPLFIDMKNLLAIVSISFIAAAPVFAQTPSLDNFDMGIKISSSSSSTTSAPAKKERGSSKTMRADDGMATRSANVYSRLRMQAGNSLGRFSTGDPVVDKYIEESCRRYKIDPLLIYAQMHQESAFKKRARSHKGASGLMQLMPATARRFGVTKIYDPQQNIDAGVRYMRWLLNKFNGDLVLALAGYNAGEGAVMKYGWNVPPYRETQNYVRRITARYQRIGSVSQASPQAAIVHRNSSRVGGETPAGFDPNLLTVRLPDGSLRLVNQ